jgi:flagellar export protein FliJ
VPQFKFRLESLKRFRDNRLLVARRDMAIVLAQVQAVESEILAASKERAQLFDLDTAASFERGFKGLIDSATTKIKQLESKLGEHKVELERHRSWVAHLGRELKIVEKLEEKKREEFLNSERLKEKRLVDSWVAERWVRRGETEVEDKI